MKSILKSMKTPTIRFRISFCPLADQKRANDIKNNVFLELWYYLGRKKFIWFWW